MPESASALPNDNKTATSAGDAAVVTEKADHNSVFDVLVIGSGAAGLTCALQLKESAPDLKLAVVAKGNLSEGNTLYAQGGISAVLEAADSTDSHIADTLDAGAGLCKEEAVRFTVDRGPKAVRWLLEHGVTFDRDDEGWHLTKEGGHSHRRVIHSADATGRAVETGLLAHARTAGFTLLPEHTVVDLITAGEGSNKRAVGAYMLHPQGNHIVAVRARAVVLATGGASKVYLYTSNPDGSTGDGVAMAWRAGCRVANMEFMQFHPTCLYHPQAKSFLVSEALRGEGAKLRLPDGTRFMPDFDERAELAPRDIVARAIDHEMKRLGADHVELDISHESPEFIDQHFPTINSRCKEFGFDLAKAPIPVVPAAHYTCGGIITDLHGRTDLAGLYAAGESASTGLHGANRLASNSLLECIVFGRAVAKHIAENIGRVPPVPELAAWDESQVTDSDEEVVVSHNWDELRRFMWDYVGIVRTDKRLARALNRCELLTREIQDYYGNFRVTRDLLELRNLATVAQLIIRSAQQRKESRGLHFTLDYPALLAAANDTIIMPPTGAASASLPSV